MWYGECGVFLGNDVLKTVDDWWMSTDVSDRDDTNNEDNRCSVTEMPMFDNDLAWFDGRLTEDNE